MCWHAAACRCVLHGLGTRTSGPLRSASNQHIVPRAGTIVLCTKVLLPFQPPSRSSAASCQLYNAILAAKRGATTGLAKPDSGPLPWLLYEGSGYLTATDLTLRIAMGASNLANGVSSELNFVLSAYTLNGTWLGFHNLTTQLQMCGADGGEAVKWRKCGATRFLHASFDVILLPCSRNSTLHALPLHTAHPHGSQPPFQHLR